MTVPGVVPLVGLSVSQLYWVAPVAMLNGCAEPSDAEIVRVLVAGAAVLGRANRLPPLIRITAFAWVTTTVTATVAGGYFAAWWPGDTEATSAQVSTDQGVSTVTLPTG